MSKILKFIEKYWLYFILAIVGVSLVIVSFDMLGVNFLKWLTRDDILVYVISIIGVGVIFLTMWLSKKFKKW